MTLPQNADTEDFSNEITRLERELSELREASQRATLSLELDEALLLYLRRAEETGLFGEGLEETAIYLLRREIERLVTDLILKVERSGQ